MHFVYCQLVRRDERFILVYDMSRFQLICRRIIHMHLSRRLRADGDQFQSGMHCLFCGILCAVGSCVLYYMQRQPILDRHFPIVQFLHSQLSVGSWII